MSDYSLESGIRRITDKRTYGFFAEVYSSYVNGNYRAAVVGLWSVVICDLLFKLETMSSIYGDSKATQILQDIESARSKNPNSPEWEKRLLDNIKQHTSLLDQAEYENLLHLQKHRHLSAHPVLTNTDALYSPTQDQARAHLRNALDAILTKPPILTKEIFQTFVEDLSDRKAHLGKYEDLKRYLEAKYFVNLSFQVEDALFRRLWKFVFKLTNQQCDENRDVNYDALRLLAERRPRAIRDLITSERAYYSQISTKTGCAYRLLMFLSYNPDIFNMLGDEARVLVEKIATKHIHDFASAYFLSASIAEHVERIRTRMRNGENLSSGSAYRRLLNEAVKQDEHRHDNRRISFPF